MYQVRYERYDTSLDSLHRMDTHDIGCKNEIRNCLADILLDRKVVVKVFKKYTFGPGVNERYDTSLDSLHRMDTHDTGCKNEIRNCLANILLDRKVVVKVFKKYTFGPGVNFWMQTELFPPK
jgi:hypothetical protein